VEKKNSMSEEAQKKMGESLTNSMMSSMKLSTIPKFYSPSVGGDIIQQENAIIDSIFKNNNQLIANKNAQNLMIINYQNFQVSLIRTVKSKIIINKIYY